MKLLVYEHITSGALAAQTLPASLAHEGDWMLSAIVQDLDDLAQFELVLMRDARLTPLNTVAQPTYHWVESSENFSRIWQQCLQQYDVFLIIAPETDNQLASLQHAVHAAGKIFLGCDTQSCQIASDKLQSYRKLADADIATPPTVDATTWLQKTHSDSQSWIVKPYDGAGCLETLLFHNTKAAIKYLSQFGASARKCMIVQPYIEGLAASLSLFVSDDRIDLLSLNNQHIDNETGRLKYTHSEVFAAPLPVSLHDAEQLAYTIKQAIPGLWGFVGIDLIIQADGTMNVIEINPRLTTSYVNLRNALSYNPAQLLHLYMQQRISPAVTV